MYAHKPTSESLNPVASLTNAEPRIHEPLRPAKDAAIHTRIHGDSKSLPKIGLQRYDFFSIRKRAGDEEL
jgi:hypothetical protein